MTRSMCLPCQVETLELGDSPQLQSSSAWIGGETRSKRIVSARCRRLLRIQELGLGRGTNRTKLSGIDATTTSDMVDLEQLEGRSPIVTASVSEIVRLDLL